MGKSRGLGQIKVFRPMPKEKLRFDSELEIYLHKVISSMRYGEEIDLEIEDNPSLYVYAAKKSAYYNCITDLKIVISKDKKKIKLYIEI